MMIVIMIRFLIDDTIDNESDDSDMMLGVFRKVTGGGKD